MISKKNSKHADISKQRQERHRKLLKMIKNYKSSREEMKKLQRIKQNTEMEINLRYLRSQHNRHYVFPRALADSEDEEEDNNPFTNKTRQYYDLRTQNQVVKKQVIKNIELIESSRRVKSLDPQHGNQQSFRLQRFDHTKGLNPINSSKRLKQRQKSAINVKRAISSIKLPELIKKQNLKTQDKNDKSIDKIIGRKLFTQANSPPKYQAQKLHSKEHIIKSNKKIISQKRIQ